jgi:multimeric flavodoxin WrbA
MPKSVLLLNGSPRKTGLTNTLLAVIHAEFDQLNASLPEEKRINSSIVHISDFKLQHCTGCDSCLRRPNKCPLAENDDHAKLEEILIKADAIIMGAPAYFGSIPGILKDLIDRSRPWKMAGYLLKDKIFTPIATAGLQNGGTNFVQDVLIHFALIQGMQVVGALGMPVLEPNLPAESLQMLGLKEFRKKEECGEIAQKACKNIAKRIFDLLNSKT